METNKPICPVLIVDDDDDLCTILSTMIKKICPVHVEHTLKNAEEYLADIHSTVILSPEILLLDNNLPDGTGVTYIKHVLDQYPEVKIILMTADASEGLKERALTEGAVYFIKKPFQAAVIHDIVLSICPDLRAA